MIREAPVAFASCIVLAFLVIGAVMYEAFSLRYGEIIDLQKATISELQNERKPATHEYASRSPNEIYIKDTAIGVVATPKIDLNKHLVVFNQIVSTIDLDQTPEIEFREYILQPDKHGNSGMTSLAGLGTRYSYSDFQFRIVGEQPHS